MCETREMIYHLQCIFALAIALIEHTQLTESYVSIFALDTLFSLMVFF